MEKVAINTLSSGGFLYSANNYCRARPVLIELSAGRFKKKDSILFSAQKCRISWHSFYRSVEFSSFIIRLLLDFVDIFTQR